MTANLNDSEPCFGKLNGLIHNIELNLKNCNRKYKSKSEIEELFAKLNAFLSAENLNDSKFIDELEKIEKDLHKSSNFNAFLSTFFKRLGESYRSEIL
jgi:hypothetical protein